MNRFIKYNYILILVFLSSSIVAQGPPITGDKAIMLAPGNVVIKTLTEFRANEWNKYIRTPLMVHYLPSSNLLVGLHLSYVTKIKGEFDWSDDLNTLGDSELLVKYQFYRKDLMAKTFRVAAKSLMTFRSPKNAMVEGIATNKYQNYFGVIAGYETIKYGITGEMGYNLVHGDNWDRLQTKLGFGLPLLKPSYPVNQINLYFEYQSNWYPQIDEYTLLFAQGLQYAKDQFTFEFAVQLPLHQRIEFHEKRVYSLLFGMRYVI